MNCWLCNKPITEPRLVATVRNFWMRLCPACTEKYGIRNEAGEFFYKEEAKHVQ